MKPQFRLQSIVELRQRERDQAATAYREALLAKEKLQTRVDELLTDHAGQQPLQSASSVGQVDTQRLIESQRYQMHLMQQVHHLRSQMQLIDTECERRRSELVKREQAVKSLDKLRAKQEHQWEKTQAERAQIALDQWASFRYWREQAED